jgi:acylglycerol lipase
MAAATGPTPPEADGLILVAPAVWGRETQGPIQSALLWMGAHLFPWMRFTGEGLDIRPSDNIEMLRAMGRDPLVIKETRLDAVYGLVGLMDRALAAAERLDHPALVLYGSHEEVMPQDAILAMLRRLPPEGNPAGPRVAVYPEGWHMLLRDLEAATVHRDVAAWIADRDAPLPSGADLLAARILEGDGDSLGSSPRTALGAEAGEQRAQTGNAPIIGP